MSGTSGRGPILMATLTRPKTSTRPPSESFLASSVPSPFPVPERERLLREEQLAAKTVNKEHNKPTQDRHDVQQELPSKEVQVSSISSKIPFVAQISQLEPLPSIALVQKSCLMTLNNLLSVPTKWNPIVPDRRHSMPSNPQSSPSPHCDTVQSSALHTLVSNLRNREKDVMIESRPSHSDTEVIAELRIRVENLSSKLDPGDAHLARTLVSLLSHLDRLSVIHATSSSRASIIGISSWNPIEPTAGPSDLFSTLKQQLSDLQIERLSHSDNSDPGTPALTVEKTLLWSQIDEELETVVLICKERTDGLTRISSADYLPPEYDPADYEYDPLPAYNSGTRPSGDITNSKTRALSVSSVNSGQNDKMRLDLESVTMAIDRLYLVTPQLHNQRVELKSSKVEQMEKARRAGGQSLSDFQPSVAKGKPKDVEEKELDNILDLLSKATDRKLSDQSVVLKGDLKARLEKSRLRDTEKVLDFIF